MRAKILGSIFFKNKKLIKMRIYCKYIDNFRFENFLKIIILKFKCFYNCDKNFDII